jgi:hypothetical protein
MLINPLLVKAETKSYWEDGPPGVVFLTKRLSQSSADLSRFIDSRLGFPETES